MNNHFDMDAFLLELLRSRSPTGVEREAADIVEKYVSSYADSVSRDVLGNRIATLGAGAKTLMLAGHMDEIGFIVSYIDENGFVFFETLGAVRVSAAHHTDNPKSGRVMQKLGMRPEGILRKNAKDNKGNFVDVCVYSMTDDDWFKKSD